MNIEDRDNEKVCEFLKLLKIPKEDSSGQRDKIITEKDWIKVLKQQKKQSASSMFSLRKCAAYK